jgi:hypothetical protein
VHEVFPLAAFESFIAAHPPRSLWLSGVASGQPAGMAIVQDWRPRRVTIRVNATEEGRLRINHFYYPGWQGRIEETGVAIPATPSAPDGLLELEVPRGDYVLVLELARELPERLGLGVSLASLLVAAALAAWMATRKQEALPPAAPAM